MYKNTPQNVWIYGEILAASGDLKTFNKSSWSINVGMKERLVESNRYKKHVSTLSLETELAWEQLLNEGIFLVHFQKKK